MRDLIGQTVAGYPIEKPLGQGAYTTTWQAKSSAAPVAVMTLREDLCLGLGQEADRSFDKTVVLGWDAVRSIQHANLVLMYSAGMDSACGAYCLKELVQGKSLRDFILHGAKVSWRDSLVLFEQVLAALQALHQAQCCHGSLCPSNLFLTQDQDVKLDEHGGLLHVERPLTELALAGLVQASALSYFAPERLIGFKPTVPNDLYSAGACLYFILAGQDLFQGEDSAAIARGVQERQPVSLSAWRDDIPELGLELITRLLSKDLSQRYRSCAEVLADLECVKAGEPLSPLRSAARAGSNLGQTTLVFPAGTSSAGNTATRSHVRISAIVSSAKISALQPKVSSSGVLPRISSGIHSQIASGVHSKTSSGIITAAARSSAGGTKIFGQLATHVKSTIPQSDPEKKGDEYFHHHQLALALKLWHEAVYVAPHTALSAKIELAELESKKEGYALCLEEAQNRLTLGDYKGAIQSAQEALAKATSDVQRQSAQKIEGQASEEVLSAEKSHKLKMIVSLSAIAVAVVVLVALYFVFCRG